MDSPTYNQWYLNEGRGKTVLLLHGLFGNLNMWSSTVEALKPNYHVVIPRLPLFDLPADNTNLPYLVDVLHQFVTYHHLYDIIIIGHGMGSQLALLYAYQYPEGVDRLVISGSTGFMFGFHAITESEEELGYGYVEEDAETAFALIESAQKTKVTFLNRIDHPVLLLWGLEDKITSPDVAMHFHDYLQNSVVHFIDRCGHVPMIDQPEAYNWHIAQFIKA